MIHKSDAYMILFGLALLPTSLIVLSSPAHVEYQKEEPDLITPVVSRLSPSTQKLIIRGPHNTYGISAEYVDRKRVDKEAIARELREAHAAVDRQEMLAAQEKLAARKPQWSALCFSSLFWTFACSSSN